MWRWDQGRLTYFSLSNIRLIASTLVQLDGVNLRSDPDPLRPLLESVVNLPFAPAHYRVWRNYSRVFKILGLASSVNNHLVTTKFCKMLVGAVQESEPLTFDEYLQFIAKALSYPSPVFQGYSHEGVLTFPFCAILKLLISKSQGNGDPQIDVDDVFGLLIGNNVTGQELISEYSTFQDSGVRGKGDAIRQVREMLIFISQLSYLSWIDGKLCIDMGALANLGTLELQELISPRVQPRVADSELEIQRLYTPDPSEIDSFDLKEPVGPDDLLFTEGEKVRVSHLRTERNRKIVRHYFESCSNPRLCNICEIEVADRYPWINNLIEVHHILPLSSPIRVGAAGTSVEDLVGLCPNCHRATHAFYRAHLADNGLKDFESEEHSKEVYSSIKSHFVRM